MLDAVGNPLTHCMIYLKLHNSYWPQLDLPDDDERDDTYDCEFCGGEIADDLFGINEWVIPAKSTR